MKVSLEYFKRGFGETVTMKPLSWVVS